MRKLQLCKRCRVNVINCICSTGISNRCVLVSRETHNLPTFDVPNILFFLMHSRGVQQDMHVLKRDLWLSLM